MQGYTFSINNETATIKTATVVFRKSRADSKGDLLNFGIRQVCDSEGARPDPNGEIFPEDYLEDANSVAIELFETGALSSSLDNFQKLKEYADPHGFWIDYALNDEEEITGYTSIDSQGRLTTRLLDEDTASHNRMHDAIISNLNHLSDNLQ